MRPHQQLPYRRDRSVVDRRMSHFLSRLNWPVIGCIALLLFVAPQIYYYMHNTDDMPVNDYRYSSTISKTTNRGERIHAGTMKFYDLKDSFQMPRYIDGAHSFARVPDDASRAAILCLYIGSALPAWFDSFAYSAQSSAALFDWIVIVLDNVPVKRVPGNVKLIQISQEELFKRFASLDDHHVPFPEEVQENVMAFLPKLTVELKPTLGYLFEDFLTMHGYSHWGYADMDQLIGRVDKLFSKEKLNGYDVLTSSYGDNYRLYLRGQLSIFRNNEKINRLWRGCKHLRTFSQRLSELSKVRSGKWDFQSAEGCFSKVVFDTPGIRFTSMTNQISDAYGAHSKDKESLMIGTVLSRCYGTGILSNSGGIRNAQAANHIVRFLSGSDSETQKIIENGKRTRKMEELREFFDFTETNRARRHDVAEGSDVDMTYPLYREHYDCAYWIHKEHQVCLSPVPADVDIEGMGTREGISYTNIDKYRCLGGSCREGVISHFQGWKRHYYVHTTRPPPSQASFLLISQYGFVPLRFPSPHSIEDQALQRNAHVFAPWHQDQHQHQHQHQSGISRALLATADIRGIESEGQAPMHGPSPIALKLPGGKHAQEGNDRGLEKGETQTQTRTQFGNRLGVNSVTYGRLSSDLIFHSALEQAYKHDGAHTFAATTSGASTSTTSNSSSSGSGHMHEHRYHGHERTGINGGAGYSTSYCMGFPATLDTCTCPLLESDINVILHQPFLDSAHAHAHTQTRNEADSDGINNIHIHNLNLESSQQRRLEAKVEADFADGESLANERHDKKVSQHRHAHRAIFKASFLHGLRGKGTNSHDGTQNSKPVEIPVVNASGVTLVTAGWAGEFVSGHFGSMLASWHGPVVIVLARFGDPVADGGDVSDEALQMASQDYLRSHEGSLPEREIRHKGHTLTVIVVDVAGCRAQMHVAKPQASSRGTRQQASLPPLPDNTLFNIGMDAAPTNVLCTSLIGANFRLFDKGSKIDGLGHGEMPVKNDYPDDLARVSVLQQLDLAQRLADIHTASRIGNHPDLLLPVALVVPSYLDESGGAHDSPRVSYPPPQHHESSSQEQPHYSCGEQHSDKLRLDFDGRINLMSKSPRPELVFSPVNFDAREFIQRKSLMPAVIFDKTASVHGDGFVRFPEEMNGSGCYGSTVARILAGSGYILHWAGFHALMDIKSNGVGSYGRHAKSTSLRDRSMPLPSSHTCGCSYIPSSPPPSSDSGSAEGSHAREESNFVMALHNYYARTVELRMKGIEDVYSRESFGGRFEREQRELQSRERSL